MINRVGTTVGTTALVVAVLAALTRLALAQSSDPAAVFFDDTVIHEIRLNVHSRDWAALKADFQGSTYFPANFRWRDQVVRNIALRWRGGGSRRPNKPSLRLDFNRFTDGQTFVGLKSFILRNNSQDPSGMRERLAMAFFRRMGMAAVREAHTRVFVNNEDLGLFTIVESPDRDFLQKNVGESTGHLYEYDFDFAGFAVGTPFAFQDLGSDPAAYVPRLFKPQTLEEDPQGEVIARFMRAINDTNAAAWRESIAEFIDLPRFIRHMAIENFLAEEDGLTGDYGPNNFYLYRFVNTNRFQFIPWDKGNTFWETNYSIFRNIFDGSDDKKNRLVLRSFQEPDLFQLYLDTLLECAAVSVDGGYLEGEVERVYAQIRSAALADTLLFTNAEFEQSVEELRVFARERSAAVQRQVAARR